jgi:hypothetical protein
MNRTRTPAHLRRAAAYASSVGLAAVIAIACSGQSNYQGGGRRDYGASFQPPEEEDAGEEDAFFEEDADAEEFDAGLEE